MAALSFGTIKIVSPQGVVTKAVGENVAAGKLVYYDSTTGTYKVGVETAATTGTIAYFAPIGVDSGNTGIFLGSGSIISDAGLSLTKGTIYYHEAGGFVPLADLDASDYITQVAIAISTTSLQLNFVNTGVQA